MIRYCWSGWRLRTDSNYIPAWWTAMVNERFFVDMVKHSNNYIDTPHETQRGESFNIVGSLSLEDFMERSSLFLIGGPTEADLNEAFAPEKKAALERLEVFMSTAWLLPRKGETGQTGQGKVDDRPMIGGAYQSYGGSFSNPGQSFTMPLPPPQLKQMFRPVLPTQPEPNSVVAIIERQIQQASAEFASKFFDDDAFTKALAGPKVSK